MPNPADLDQRRGDSSQVERTQALLKRADALREEGRWGDALDLSFDAARGDRTNAVAAHNLGVLLFKFGRLQEAEAELRHARYLAPGAPAIEHGLAHALLAQGKYKEGWQLYRARERLPELNTGFPQNFPFPRWEGESLAGKCLAVFPEQGLGDQIQFARFLPRLIAEARVVILLTMKPLERLFRYNFPETEVFVAEGSVEFPDPDCWTTPHDLMRVLGVELHHIPNEPYLSAPATWPSPGAGFKVGLKTRGNPRHVNDKVRSLPAGEAARLGDSLPGIVVSLEPDDSGAQDMAETAALIEQLDLVVSVDTSVAHLAGALGKPCLLLLPGFAPDWRWMLGRDDSPWYPNHRLYRGRTNCDWQEAIDRVIADANMRAIAAAVPREQPGANDRAWLPHRAGEATALPMPGARSAEPLSTLIATADLNPDDPFAALNLGAWLTKLGRLEEAEIHCRRALALAPGEARAAYALGNNLLAQGRLPEGLPFFAARAELPELSLAMPKGLPFARWQGESLHGKRLAVFPEPYLGDEIQFVRFLPQILAQGAQVTLLTPPALVDLFRLNFPDVDVVQASGSTDFPDPDYWTTPYELARFLGVEVKTLSSAAYLRAPTRPAALGNGFKIGVKLRSDAAPIRDGDGSLGDAEIQRLVGGLSGTIVSLEPQDLGTSNFADIAAIIHELDIVIAVDTSVAHLAGALGKTCLLLIPGFAADWRWMVGRSDSPWYRRHRVYRSEPDGNWGPAVDRILADLKRADTPGRRLMRDAAALRSEGRFLEALAVGRKALAVDANNPFTIYNVARLLTDLGELEEGEALQRQALALAPDRPDIRFGLGLNLLAQGRYEEAWPFYEARADVTWLNCGFPQRVRFPRWRGEDISAKRIAVFPEQGLGDALQFARLLPWLQTRSRDIVLFAAKPLVELFRLAFPAMTIVPAVGAASFPKCDVWTTIVEIARYAGITPDAVPAGDYLEAFFPSSKRADGFRVGIMTRGNPAYINDAHRSLPQESADLLRRGLPGRLVELDPEISGAGDFLDTARLMADLDIVVSVDTSVGHLAGAMGKPCLLLVNGFATDWRWMRGREDSAWYPGHSLFRRASTGDWRQAIARVIDEAGRRARDRASGTAAPLASA